MTEKNYNEKIQESKKFKNRLKGKIKFQKSYIVLFIIAGLMIWSWDEVVGFTEEKKIQNAEENIEIAVQIINEFDSCREIGAIGILPLGKSMTLTMIVSPVFPIEYTQEQKERINNVWSIQAHELCDTGLQIYKKNGNSITNLDFDNLTCKEIAWLIEQSSIWERNQWENELYKRCVVDKNG